MIRDLSACPRPEQGTAVTIGAYDGVHRGHRLVISQIRERAAERGLATAVVTFDRHPATVVRPESAPRLLTDLDQKLELLAELGVDYTVVLTFDAERASERAEDFITEILVGCLRARLVAVGADFHFGQGRRGNVPMLRREGRHFGFDVDVIELVGVDGSAAPESERVSSTAIRQALAAGDVGTAARLLGRPHEVRGVVERGDARGRGELRMPTANVAVAPELLIPADGVYAGWYERPDGTVHPAALSVGTRPTYYGPDGPRLLEAYLLDFDGDLYGEAAKVRFAERLRSGQERFDSVEALAAQMSDDAEAARAALAR